MIQTNLIRKGAEAGEVAGAGGCQANTQRLHHTGAGAGEESGAGSQSIVSGDLPEVKVFVLNVSMTAKDLDVVFTVFLADHNDRVNLNKTGVGPFRTFIKTKVIILLFFSSSNYLIDIFKHKFGKRSCLVEVLTQNSLLIFFQRNTSMTRSEMALLFGEPTFEIPLIIFTHNMHIMFWAKCIFFLNCT